MEVSEDSIELLRDVVEAFAPGSLTYEAKRLSALAILDRLSPAPEPDVDEATVWTRKVMNGWTTVGGLRAVIAELIASKDAEREKAVNYAVDRIKEACANRPDWEKLWAEEKDKAEYWQETNAQQESELATLRAENERLKNMVYTVNKAAERNTAEQKGGAECTPEVEVKAALADRAETSAPSYAYGHVHTDGSRSGGMPPGTNAGAVEVQHWSDCAVNSEPAYPAGECNCGGYVPGVEVTQADWDAYDDLMSDDNYDDPNVGKYYFAHHRTEAEAEAEARGRRVALEGILHRSAELHNQGYSAAYTLDAIETELKRMMTGEK